MRLASDHTIHGKIYSRVRSVCGYSSSNIFELIYFGGKILLIYFGWKILLIYFGGKILLIYFGGKILLSEVRSMCADNRS